MGLLAGEKSSWSWWPGEQAVLEGWLMLCSGAWACEVACPYRLPGQRGMLRLGFVFPQCCVTPPASCSVWCYPTAILLWRHACVPPSRVSQEKAELNGVIHSWASCPLTCWHWDQRDRLDQWQNFLFPLPHLGAAAGLIAHLAQAAWHLQCGSPHLFLNLFFLLEKDRAGLKGKSKAEFPWVPNVNIQTACPRLLSLQAQ